MFSASAAITSVMVWFMLTTYIAQDARIARLASAITNNNTIAAQKWDEIDTTFKIVQDAMADRWRRAHMIRFCLEFEKLNEGIKCPSPIRISPSPPPRGPNLAPPASLNLAPLPPRASSVQPSEADQPAIARSLALSPRIPDPRLDRLYDLSR